MTLIIGNRKQLNSKAQKSFSLKGTSMGRTYRSTSGERISAFAAFKKAFRKGQKKRFTKGLVQREINAPRIEITEYGLQPLDQMPRSMSHNDAFEASQEKVHIPGTLTPPPRTFYQEDGDDQIEFLSDLLSLQFDQDRFISRRLRLGQLQGMLRSRSQTERRLY